MKTGQRIKSRIGGEIMKRDKGFTLIELIVVISIVSIIIGIGGLSLSGLFNTSIDAYAEDVATTLIEARYKNMAYADVYYVEIIHNDSNKNYTVELHREYIDAAATKDEIISTKTIEGNCKVTFKMDSEIEANDIKDLPNNKLTIKFKRNGAVSQNAGVIYIAKNSDTKVKQVVLNILTGKAVVSDAD